MVQLGWLANELQGSARLLPLTRIRETHTASGVDMGSGDLNFLMLPWQVLHQLNYLSTPLRWCLNVLPDKEFEMYNWISFWYFHSTAWYHTL